MEMNCFVFLIKWNHIFGLNETVFNLTCKLTSYKKLKDMREGFKQENHSTTKQLRKKTRKSQKFTGYLISGHLSYSSNI